MRGLEQGFASRMTTCPPEQVRLLVRRRATSGRSPAFVRIRVVSRPMPECPPVIPHLPAKVDSRGDFFGRRLGTESGVQRLLSRLHIRDSGRLSFAELAGLSASFPPRTLLGGAGGQQNG